MTKIEKLFLQEAALLEENNEISGRIPKDVMIQIGFADGHVHSVYPDDESLTRNLIYTAMGDFQIETKKEEKIVLPKRIIFHNRQAIGDILMMTCGIRDFKKAFPEIEVQVESTAMHIWDYNPNICRDKWDSVIDGKEDTEQKIKQAIEENKPIKLYIGPSKGTNASNRSDKHFANAYRMSIEDILNVKIPQGPIRPDIYMTKEEYGRSPIFKKPYWLITAGEKGDWTCKTYPFQKWQEVVEKLPDVTFVQLGSLGHKHPELKGNNVINYIGKTQDRTSGIRDLFNLFLNCEGSVGLVSFQMHLAAAFNKSCVVMAGAREPVWFTRYPGQNYMSSDGCLPCTVNGKDFPVACWYCKLERCNYKDEYFEHSVPRCANVFSSDDVVREIKRYYDGGRLSWNKTSEKSKLVNVVNVDAIVENKEVETARFGFGGGFITERDWEFIQETIEKYDVKTVLEFGAGLSTVLINSVLKGTLVTYETDPLWIEKVEKINKSCDIRKWDGVNFDTTFAIPFDMAFVDGPAGGENREASVRAASEFAKIVIVHDAGRVPERKWQTMYLKDKFRFVSKGGHRCHLWEKSSNVVETIVPCEIIERQQKSINVLFNGRGEGGAERSTTWIMNRFIDLGWKVQYFSPNGKPSGTFIKEGKKEVEFITDLSVVDKCDILFLYANDWVWEFPSNEVRQIMHSVNAKRKVMAINYRLGNIGDQKALWTIGWDKYVFLNSSLEETLLNRMSGACTKVLPPPTNLNEFYKTKIMYGENLRLVRHSSQGDVKYPKDFGEQLERILFDFFDVEIYLMPAPSFLTESIKNNSQIHLFKRNQPEVKEFLSFGNVFWYQLPEGFHDQGPKVIMEAMASGLPVIANNHSGAKDRVVGGTGFLCDNFDEHINAMKALLSESNRKLLGENARLHAKNEFTPENWIKEIIG